MTQQGKFILFTLDEFASWLDNLILHRKISLIQNHHTFLPDYKAFNKRKTDKYFTWLVSMEAAHQERGFSEIAQNITTFPDGMLAICRNFETLPAGIKGANANGICMEHLGNFDLGKDTMTEEHKHTIVTINALLCAKFKLGISTKSVVYHHWYDLNTGKQVVEGTGTTKTCPGTNFFGGNTKEACQKNFLPLVEQVVVVA
ncbi:N-acetylmuramoyl-L-alanine amidase [Chryseolinea soli]|uniref:N-acetylmuramoyl-L-alanine amidase n=1 Tax=Chryseolinea soli TaxID=2321403 RepID=A0A385SKG7_9BACT|nr:N-acetylmuramoyl-L-alanine amidase [Chryseolinea soli]AYB30966.1 N-acetylmuramoyl-L-alanine amidase [Chryseolinea soli]